MSEMLPDGTNPEGVDPEPPLEWTKEILMSADIKFYGIEGSPACAKVLAYLNFFGIKFEFVKGTGKPSSEHYKKFPVIDVNGRQVNDSAVIVKNMAMALAGSEFNESWEKRITYSLQTSIELKIMGSWDDFSAWAAEPHGFGMPYPALWMIGGMIMSDVKGKLPTNPLNILVEPAEIFADFKKAMQGEFFGGVKPSMVDVSFYGTCITWIASNVPLVHGYFKEAGLWDWVLRMNKVLPVKSLYPDCSFDPTMPPIEATESSGCLSA